MNSPYHVLNRAAAAKYLTDTLGIAVTVNTLARHAHLGTGPRYGEVLGQCCYRREDLDAWVRDELARPPGAPGRRRRGAATVPTVTAA